MATTEADLNAAAARSETAGTNLTTVALAASSVLSNALSQINTLMTEARSLTARAEAAADAVESGGGTGPVNPDPGTSKVVAYFDFKDLEEGSSNRPATIINKGPARAAGNEAYVNRGGDNSAGGKYDQYGPIPGAPALFTDASNGGRMALSSPVKETFTDVFTTEALFRMGNGDGTVISIGDTGADSGQFYARLFINDQGVAGKRSFTFGINALGEYDSVTTDLLDELILNEQKCFHVAFSRNSAGKFEVRAQGVLAGTTTKAFPGTVVAYVNSWGTYRQGDNQVDSPFRGSIGFARTSREMLYTGATYTVPRALPALT